LKHFAHSTKVPAILKRIKQLINILFCGYRRSTIRDKPILAWAQVPQRVIKHIETKIIDILEIDSSVLKSVQVSSIVTGCPISGWFYQWFYRFIAVIIDKLYSR
jgi:hypothetical protein